MTLHIYNLKKMWVRFKQNLNINYNLNSIKKNIFYLFIVLSISPFFLKKLWRLKLWCVTTLWVRYKSNIMNTVDLSITYLLFTLFRCNGDENGIAKAIWPKSNTPRKHENALAFKKDKEYRIGNTHPITPQSFSLLLVG